MPDDSEKHENVDDTDKAHKPNLEAMDEIAEEMEKIFFEKSHEKKLSPYEMSMVLHRVSLLFDEYKLMHFLSKVGEMQQPNVEFKGSTHLYK